MWFARINTTVISKITSRYRISKHKAFSRQKKKRVFVFKNFFLLEKKDDNTKFVTVVSNTNSLFRHKMSSRRRFRFHENGTKFSHYEKYLQLHDPTTHFSSLEMIQASYANTENKGDDENFPPGYVRGKFSEDSSAQTDNSSNATNGGGNSEANRNNILLRQAWDTAKSPFRQIFMTALMMYMSGNVISIFSLMMIMMAMWNPISALINVNNAFARYENADNPSQLYLPKLVFMLLNLISIGIGVWKFDSLGLLPTGSHVPPTLQTPLFMEFSAPASVLK
ncbi:hypothetical protein RFI_22871 [Reticulomyxa filosa]|uniref:ER membrane protein complex subunit 4 n=1 Tax=Reticulomyxa filosa TaxID=46433 RepID=X6MLJ1_RETFI|nr:hypothetical protein RFI_22871 [Reticulomyxa filosa]|eukprot:ETO14511.1 hypothetical protein RFI_22871 [Reticulomyxa filosa]